MTPFEYVMVLVSIILGLGITTILTGLAEIIKHNRQFRLYPPYIIWMILVFVLHIHEWWVSYALKGVEVWRLPMFLFILLYPINLYVLAHLLFPADVRQDFDSKTFYLENHPRLFGSASIIVALSIIHNMTVEGYHFADQLVQFGVLAILLFVLVSRNKNTAVHTIISLLLLVIMLAGLAFSQETVLKQ